jgi:hypothetical protein
VPVFEDLEQIAPLLLAQRGQAPVVEHEHVDLGELPEQPRVGAVGVRERELFEETRHAAVERAPPRAASVLRERARQVGLMVWCTPVADLEPLAGLRALEELNVEYTNVTDLSPLAGLPKLHTPSFKGRQHTAAAW